MENKILSKEHRPIPQSQTNNRICNCSHPWKSSLININGDVHACPHSGLKLGNLHESTFEEIWNGDTLQSIRKHIKRGEQHPACKSAECPFQIEHSGIDTGNEWIDIEAKPGTNKELAHA
ncbi:SPASM domain-containing protein [Puniceicoccaceae bacterium K14]|nr:SPASM domain-containing protein [Puniceicoccaceae bacterium K14]